MPLATINNLKKRVGCDLGPSEWLTITQEQVDKFAISTLDHQFIHVDVEKASKSPFAGTIAHGFLTLSLLSHFAEKILLIPEGASVNLNYGLNKVRFLMPVLVGKRVRCFGKLLGIIEKNKDKYLTTSLMTIEIEGEKKPALIAEWLTMAVINSGMKKNDN
ncbi:MAG: MaoC family dehydratase [Sphingomonadales bacterium]